MDTSSPTSSPTQEPTLEPIAPTSDPTPNSESPTYSPTMEPTKDWVVISTMSTLLMTTDEGSVIQEPSSGGMGVGMIVLIFVIALMGCCCLVFIGYRFYLKRREDLGYGGIPLI